MHIQLTKQQIPWLMAAGRAALGPIVIAGERCGWNGFVLASLIVTALLSDIFDGILARRWACDTAGVRLFDSMADTFLYACVVGALWMGQPALWAAWRAPIALLLAVEAACIAFDLVKFGKPASYHSYLAKTWGLVLAATVVTVFATQRATPLLALAVGLGVVCNLEGLAMSLMLPMWRKDIKTLAAAWRLRRQMRPPRKSPRGFVAKTAALLVLLCLALPSWAIAPGEARYAGGTVSGLDRDVNGKLDLIDPTGLNFTPEKGSALHIPYTRIRNFAQHDDLTHRLGVLLTITVTLLRAREHTYTLSVAFTDNVGALQVIRLEVPRADVKLIGEVLQRHAGDAH